MADKEEKEESSREAEVQPKKSKKKLILIVGISFFVLLVLIAVPAYFFLFSSSDKKTEKLESDAAEQKEIVLMMEGFEEEDEASEVEEVMGAFFPFDTFVINLSGGGYLRCQVQIEFAARDVSKKFLTKLIPIRDELINLMSNQTRELLTTEEGRGDLKRLIKETINTTLRKEEVKKVYFSQFVIQ